MMKSIEPVIKEDIAATSTSLRSLPVGQEGEGLIVTIVGVGLISGSFALAMKEKGIAKKIIGVSKTEESLQKAKELGIIDEALPLEEAVKQSDFIYVAIPVDATVVVMKQIMDLLTDKQMVADAGSTKFALCDALKAHPMRPGENRGACSDVIGLVEAERHDPGPRLPPHPSHVRVVPVEHGRPGF